MSRTSPATALREESRTALDGIATIYEGIEAEAHLTPFAGRAGESLLGVFPGLQQRLTPRQKQRTAAPARLRPLQHPNLPQPHA